MVTMGMLEMMLSVTSAYSYKRTVATHSSIVACTFCVAGIVVLFKYLATLLPLNCSFNQSIVY